MAICSDPALTYLNNLGYNVVRLPRGGIEPLDVLGRDPKSMERLGRLDQIWASAVPVPEPREPENAVKVKGQTSREINLSIGLKILETIVGGLGAEVPQLSTAYKRAKKVVFSFADPEVVGIDAFVVGKYLAGGDLDTDNPFVTRYFSDEDTDAFVITEVLKARAITVSAVDSSGTDVGLDVASIQDMIGGDVKVTGGSGRQGELTYEGTKAITFGFKCYEIAYVDGRWTVTGARADADLAFSLPVPGAQPEPVVLRRGGRVRLK